MVYNREFTKIPLLINNIIQDVRPDNRTSFIMHDGFAWMLIEGLDAQYKLAYANVETEPKIYTISLGQLRDTYYARGLPDNLIYIEFPTQNNE